MKKIKIILIGVLAVIGWSAKAQNPCDAISNGWFQNITANPQVLPVAGTTDWGEIQTFTNNLWYAPGNIGYPKYFIGNTVTGTGNNAPPDVSNEIGIPNNALGIQYPYYYTSGMNPAGTSEYIGSR